MRKTSRKGPVTPAEHVVLQTLWELGVGTVAAIHAAMPARRRLAYNTVLTQVRFLHAKGYVLREALGRAHVYRPRFGRDEVLRRVVRHFEDCYFDGSREKLERFLEQQARTGG